MIFHDGMLKMNKWIVRTYSGDILTHISDSFVPLVILLISNMLLTFIRFYLSSSPLFVSLRPLFT